ncbi:type II toxin-antitoxin system RelB/DinJ family antitoxin [Companilactobacillus zhachilii]|uniref:type II toxin-antitoxin system RelB/DinJ family antitoxin n=1 Tax=Companilactobacillus zhachilii TaxID=2304606 RepID=UPI00142289AD|nr:type II toxin-antitoxin system RelB/DinJ family antitoxin [Companilactobacillus zhachilii]
MITQNNLAKKDSSKSKVRIQVDKTLKQDAEKVLSNLGMTLTDAVTMLFKRIVATDSFPVSLQLTNLEKANQRLLKATQDIPVKNLNNQKDVEDWLKETSEDDE